MNRSKIQVAIFQKELQKRKTKYWRNKTEELKIENLNLYLEKEIAELIDKFEYKLRQKWTPEIRKLFERNFEKFNRNLNYAYGEIIDAIVKKLESIKIEKMKRDFVKKFENFYKDEAEKIEKDYEKRLNEQEKKWEEEEKKLWIYIKKRWTKKDLKKMFKKFHGESFKRLCDKIDKS